MIRKFHSQIFWISVSIYGYFGLILLFTYNTALGQKITDPWDPTGRDYTAESLKYYKEWEGNSNGALNTELLCKLFRERCTVLLQLDDCDVTEADDCDDTFKSCLGRNCTELPESLRPKKEKLVNTQGNGAPAVLDKRAQLFSNMLRSGDGLLMLILFATMAVFLGPRHH